MNRYKQLSIFVVVFLLSLTTLLSGFVQNVNAAEDELGLSAEAAILLDADTGKILYEKNADVVLGVASMAKMMTEYLVLEAIHDGKITWDQPVRINEYVHRLSAAPGLSNVGLTQGEDYTVEELYQAMAIHSGNAATVALAELIGGTEKNFVELMNAKAEELNLQDYKFVNSSGLNNSSLLGNHPAGAPDEENVMSARATARLAYRLLTDYPEVLDTASQPRLPFRDGKTYDNFNFMLPTLIHEYPGIDGLKTGSTNFAGYGFTATAKRGDQRFISVVMKAETRDIRFSETAKIMNYAFSNFKKEQLFDENYQIKGKETVPVTKGKEDQVQIQTEEELALTIKNGEKEAYKPKLVLDKEKLNEDGELTAPIEKGETIGYVTVEHENGEDIRFLTQDGHKQIQIPVTAAESVEKANWFVLSMRGIGGFFGDLFSTVASTVKGLF
ncbi:D-alanyl-D-alanine carboxypeptidase (penicillin-binding protein 5/6) [Mesobacillus persicus]|uniref:serine-type D-Ala-D-Ala carboxypeptidase n=1 Tax=Mesobacillus persicus TaxID=930146 RepID=A0A1H8KRZ3_9BACI|nr:D-alanyl-D-alanine carboxypeptidase family protein [Mesobacillus persicus]SEN95168.1 D-alanyl-D-alanine carboxypeptidase (penicillin-binding protein 5/6) [Mesobacillus persicus]